MLYVSPEYRVMPKIDWKSIWEKAINNKEIFPVKIIDKSTVSISCPTRFSNAGKFSINVSPSFNDNSIVLELLVFNDNISAEDLNDIAVERSNDKDTLIKDEFNALADQLASYELSNRVVERFKIKSDGFESDEEAEDALVDYINNKATESGRMFDNKLDSLNDILMKDENFIRHQPLKPNYNSVLETIKSNRKVILSKVESILNSNYKWNSSKNEDYSDSVMPLYDKNKKLAAVVTIVDDCIVVDIANGIAAKVSMLQSDNSIEAELVDDIDNAVQYLSDKESKQELDDLKDAVSGNLDSSFEDKYDVDIEDDDSDYLDDLSKRIARLESLYINKRLRRLY